MRDTLYSFPRFFRRFGVPLVTLFALAPAFVSTSARADYAWLPVYRKMVVRTGADWYKSYENFDTNGFVTDLNVGGAKSELRDFIPYVFGEYGVSERLSIWSRLQYVDSVVSAQGSGNRLAAGNGLGDTWIGFKRSLGQTYPFITLETFFKFPLGASTGQSTSDVVQGEGNVDIGFRAHVGHREGPVLLALSPGILVRFGGYSSAGIIEAAIQYNYREAYGRIYADGMLSFSPTALPPSTLTNHNLLGTAGSYMKLSASPTYFGMGARAGYNFTRAFGLEAFVAMNFQGARIGRFLKFGTNLIFTFDFYEGDYKPKVHEVPFHKEKEPENPKS